MTEHRNVGHLPVLILVALSIVAAHQVVVPILAVDSEQFAAKTVAFVLVPDPQHDTQTLVRERPSPSPAAPLPSPVAPPAIAPGLDWPVSSGWITQYYSWHHKALDIAAHYGSAVVAAADGVVVWAGWRTNGGGYVVAIDHGFGIVTFYNHLSRIVVVRGQEVVDGQIVGRVGCTGICTGPHVHFAVLVNGIWVNPLRYLSHA